MCTQGDPLTMAMYALAIAPLIKNLNEHHGQAKQVWGADDTSAAGSSVSLKGACGITSKP